MTVESGGCHQRAQRRTQPSVASVDHKADVTDNTVVGTGVRSPARWSPDVMLTGGRRPRVVGFEIGDGPAGNGFVPIGTQTAVSPQRARSCPTASRTASAPTSPAWPGSSSSSNGSPRHDPSQPTPGPADHLPRRCRAHRQGHRRRARRPQVSGLHTGDGVVDLSSIRSFEGDAVTYDGVPRLVDTKADSPIGRRILDEDGDELGKLADLELDASGSVSVVLLADGGRSTADASGRRLVRRHRGCPSGHDVDRRLGCAGGRCDHDGTGRRLGRRAPAAPSGRHAGLTTSAAPAASRAAG